MTLMASKTTAKTGRTTIYDVAKVAGVSAKTVARVINREKHVGKATKAKVEAVLAELNYQPNTVAKRLGLKDDRSFLIGLLYDNPSANYISRLLIGTLERCDDYGYRLAVESVTPERVDPEATRKPDLIDRADLDGIIVTAPISDDMPLIKRLEKAGHRIIRIAPFKEPNRTPRVYFDDIEAAYQITRHLIEFGHKRIAHIEGLARHGSASARMHGYVKAMEEAELDTPHHFMLRGDYTFASGMEHAKSLLSRDDRPTAIFAANDEMAAGVMYAAQGFGLSVPKDLSVAGFDDIPLSRIIEPNITTIRQPLEEMAQAAAELVITIQAGQKSPEDAETKVDFVLNCRGSTGPAPVS